MMFLQKVFENNTIGSSFIHEIQDNDINKEVLNKFRTKARVAKNLPNGVIVDIESLKMNHFVDINSANVVEPIFWYRKKLPLFPIVRDIVYPFKSPLSLNSQKLYLDLFLSGKDPDECKRLEDSTRPEQNSFQQILRERAFKYREMYAIIESPIIQRFMNVRKMSVQKICTSIPQHWNVHQQLNLNCYDIILHPIEEAVFRNYTSDNSERFFPCPQNAPFLISQIPDLMDHVTRDFEHTALPDLDSGIPAIHLDVLTAITCNSSGQWLFFINQNKTSSLIKAHSLTTREILQEYAETAMLSSFFSSFNELKVGLINLCNKELQVIYRAPFCLQRSNNVIHVHLIAKIEFQCEFGLEELTVYELRKMYFLTKLFPSSIVWLMRVDSDCRTVLAVDEYSPMKITQLANKDPKFNYYKSFLPPLLDVIAWKEFQIIHHEYESQNVNILKPAHEIEKCHFNFKDLYVRAYTTERNVVSWLPVDRHRVLPFHKKLKRMPLTFPAWDDTNVHGKKKKNKKNKKQKSR